MYVAAGMHTTELCDVYEVTDYFSLYFSLPCETKHAERPFRFALKGQESLCNW